MQQKLTMTAVRVASTAALVAVAVVIIKKKAITAIGMIITRLT